MFSVKRSSREDNIELLTRGRDRDVGSTALGKPTTSHICSWKDYVAVIICLVACTVAVLVVFVPRYAVYFGQTRQFIWVGLCLNVMAWCALYTLRRLFLICTAESKAATLQSLDAILRSDPTTMLADWRISVALTFVLALGPALSIAYKSLGGGRSHYIQHHENVQLGMTGPPGTQNLGFGLSQFVNATLPWFKDPGFPDRVYGFNMHVATENMTAMLDGPSPSYVEAVQSSMTPGQSTIVTGDVVAIVCEQNAQLSDSVEYFVDIYNDPSSGENGATTADAWINDDSLFVSMLLPDSHNIRNIVIGGYNTSANETFGSHLRQYTISRQKYTGTWHISQNSVQLISATAQHQTVDDASPLLSDNFRSFELYKIALGEYDWRYRASYDAPSAVLHDAAKYSANIKSDSTFLASMVWSRLTAVDGPETWPPNSSAGVYGGQGYPELRYEIDAKKEVTATTMKPNFVTALVLAINPVLLLASLLIRIIVWPRSPVGEGFGVVSLLASVEQRDLPLLKGAGFSGKLQKPVFVRFLAGREADGSETGETARLTTVLSTSNLRGERLNKGVPYG